MGKYLDQNGLLYLWQQIKTKINAAKTTINNTLTSTSTTEALSAAQGKVLDDKISGILSDIGNLGGGDMLKATYDRNGDGVVDDAAKLGGKLPSYYAAATDIPTTVSQLADAGSYALKSEITNVYKYKGSKSTASDLPSSGNTAGDVWNVEATNMNYAWTGSEWDPLGEVFTIESISNAEIDTIMAS